MSNVPAALARAASPGVAPTHGLQHQHQLEGAPRGPAAAVLPSAACQQRSPAVPYREFCACHVLLRHRMVGGRHTLHCTAARLLQPAGLTRPQLRTHRVQHNRRGSCMPGLPQQQRQQPTPFPRDILSSGVHQRRQIGQVEQQWRRAAGELLMLPLAMAAAMVTPIAPWPRRLLRRWRRIPQHGTHPLAMKILHWCRMSVFACVHRVYLCTCAVVCAPDGQGGPPLYGL